MQEKLQIKHCKNSKVIKPNKPLYFYHLVDKNSDLTKGILSLKYMYDHHQEELFAKYTLKYQDRVAQELKKDPQTLIKEDYLTWFNHQRGKNGASYIYFFRYPPTTDLGNHMQDILKDKDIYCIDINDEKLRQNILDIFYGYDVNTKKSLDQTYYDNVTKEEYFAHYQDNIAMNFSTINHIAIMFKEDYCPMSFIKKVNK